jgi:SAM-dependent methyltransferase
MSWLLAAAGTIAVAGFLYWLLILTEGVYLGYRVVVWLYDITAARYDRIKQFSPPDDHFTIVRPLLRALGERPGTRLLDVATGTGRVPAALLAEPRFAGRAIGLEPAARMLEQAQAKLRPLRDECDLVRSPAVPLPFRDQSFDAVSCLEAIEFFPSDVKALREMARVLKPGGFLLTSLRVGWESRLFLFRHRSHQEFARLLEAAGFGEVDFHLWETSYDMVVARKAVTASDAD